MKLQQQLNLAFSTLLLVILTVSGFIIYSMLLDLLIEEEQRQLEETGQLLANVLNQQYSEEASAREFYNLLNNQNLQLLMYNRNEDTVLFSTMPEEIVVGLYAENDFADTSETLWEFGSDRFVTSRILVLPQILGLELILFTPLHDLRAVQQDFFFRFTFIFVIGAIAALFLSYFLTKKLVTPLTELQRQLKKIEKRNFSEVKKVEATGEIKDVAESFYSMANELERYINTQQTFFQNASHELKTPLMTIQGYAEGIKDGIFDEEEQQKGLEVMVTEVNRLKKIINEMILLAKLDSEQTNYEEEEIRVGELTEQVIDRVIPMANENRIQLEQSTEGEALLVAGDEEKMLRSLLNITMNGIRHAASTVKLSVYEENKFVIVSIEDDGPGVDDQLKANIFHRFVKGKNGETGLGLAIARAIIEQSNGTIAVEASETMGGAKFVIRLPALNR